MGGGKRQNPQARGPQAKCSSLILVLLPSVMRAPQLPDHPFQIDNLCRHFLVFTRAIAWSLAAAIVVLSIVPPHLRPETFLSHGLEHFAIFAATGVAFSLGYQQKRLRLTVLLVIFCGVVEIAQLFAPGRHARLADFIMDALAVCAGVVMPLLGKQLVDRSKS
jgi:VanZ family protein